MRSIIKYKERTPQSDPKKLKSMGYFATRRHHTILKFLTDFNVRGFDDEDDHTRMADLFETNFEDAQSDSSSVESSDATAPTAEIDNFRAKVTKILNKADSDVKDDSDHGFMQRLSPTNKKNSYSGGKRFTATGKSSSEFEMIPMDEDEKNSTSIRKTKLLVETSDSDGDSDENITFFEEK